MKERKSNWRTYKETGRGAFQYFKGKERDEGRISRKGKIFKLKIRRSMFLKERKVERTQ